MPGRGNNSVEFQVSLGLQGAKQQIDSLHKALEESVKIDSNGFKGINKMLESAQSQAEKLSSKMGEAFKTSAGSRNFLKDYQKMLETLSQIRSKMGNLGFDDIKFSVQDQNEINDAVKKMQDLEKVTQSIQSGKAINVINNSSVENVDILKKKISDLSIDTSKLTFDNLKVRLSDAAEEASSKLAKTEERINNIDSVIKKLDASGLQEIQNKISTSTGLSTKLIDDKSIDEANRKLRELTEQFNGLSDKTKSNLQVNQKTGDISNFIQKQTENIKAEYQKQIEAIRTSKEAINKAMQSINTSGHKGKNGQTYYNAQELTELVNSEAMKTQIDALGINLTELFKDKTIAQQISALKEALTKGLESLTIKENDLTNLRNSFEQALQNIFTGLTTSSVTNVKVVKDRVTETFSNFDIKAIDLKNFGFDIDKISAGETLASVYDRLKNAIDQYVVSLGAEKSNLSSTELVQRSQALKDLEAAQKAADAAQGQSDEVLKTLQEQIAECTQKIEELVQKYNQLTGQKIDLNLGDIPKQTDQAVTGINRYIESITKLEGKQKALSNVQSAVTRWMGFYQVLNLTKRAINDMKQHIQELDAVMTKIAVVTNMTQNDLWNQIGTYSEIARQYGVAIKGVYEVSQIYYQQGLNKGDVMGLTTETLKMARIAGIDYATAADYMTTAVRGFKLEMSDAAHVTDVFSNLAAHTASSTEELAVAISKTAASAASVGASFESTSAMMATMIATTRESATNIGTALKSIIARYGELKENMTGTDAEGEEYSLNKVDKALQSVGISIHDAAGQFRDFDDVILELAEAWGTIDKNTQRYIATVMAGNRQQSRFLALVSNVEEYKRALDLANNSDSAGELQVLKTLDSIDAKIERMKVTIQEFYTSSGIEEMYKGILDTITNVISAANDMPKAFGNIPVTAMAVGMSVVSTIKNVLSLIIASISQSIEMIKANNVSALQGLVQRFGEAGTEAGKTFKDNAEKASAGIGNSLSKNLSGIIARYAGALASVGGSALVINGMNQYGSSTKEDDDRAAGRKMLGGYGLNVLGGALSGAASGAAMGAAAGPHAAIIGAALGGISSLITNIGSLISGIDMLNVSLARQIELSRKRLEAAKTEETKAKASEKELSNAYTKLIDLQTHQFDSIESAKEYADYMNQLADIYPSFVQTISTSGDVIIDAEKMEQALADARLNTANATLNAVKAEQNKTELQLKNYQDLSSNIGELQKDTAYNENDIYKLLFNKQAIGSRNRATSIMEQYNLWASASGKEIANINPQGYQTYEDAARVWMKNHIAELNSFMEATLTASDMSTDIGNYQKEALTSARDSLANHFIALLTETQSAAEAAGESLNFSALLGEEIDSLDDIKSWNYTKIKTTLDRTQDSIQGYIGSTNETLAAVNDAIIRTEIKQAVQTSLNKLRDTGELEKKQASILQNYEGLISGMLGGRYNYHVDWTTDTNSNIIKGLEDWVYQHQNEAAELNDLDYNQYRSTGELETKLKSLLVDMDPVAVEEYITKSFQPAFEAARAAVTAGMKNQLDQNKLGSSELAQLIDGEIEDTNGELINSLIPSLRSGITEYSKLAKNGLSSVANNYLTSLKEIYTSIGQLESDQQLEIVSIISTLDFSDKDALLSAAENLRELGYEDVASSLESAAQRLVINIGGGLQALQASTGEVAKKLENAADKFSKGIKYSEAMETAASLNTELSFDQLYQYSDAANGWVLTQAGIDEQINSILSENQKKADELQTNAQRRSSVLSLYKQLGQGMDKDAFRSITHLEDTDLDNEYANFEQLVKDFEESGETNFEEYLKKQLEQNNKYLEQINEISEDLTTNVLSDTLVNINYADISQGTQLDFNKSLIESVLKIAGAGEEVLEQFDTEIWPQMLAGHFEGYNTLLSSLGFKASVSSTTEQNAQKANVEQYTNGIKELLTASSNAILSEETQALLSESGIDIGSISRKNAAQELIANAKSLLDKGEMSLEAYNSILETANNAAADNLSKALGGGRTKAVLDMAKEGLTIDELKNFANTYHESLSDFINEDTHKITNSVLASIMKYDTDTGTFKFDENATAEQILNALSQAFNITIENYTDAASQTIASQIAERAKNNTGKQIANQIQALSSAKVGDEIDVSLLTPTMREALSLAEGQQTLIIESEKRRDALLLLLESSIEAYEGEGKAALQATYDSIKSSIESKVTPSRMSGLSGMLSTTVDKAGAETFLKSWGYDDLSKIDIAATMERYGYEWNNFTQTFKATDKALVWARERLAEARAKGADDETINQLEAQVKKLGYELNNNPARDALMNLLSSYENVSNDILAEFAAQFDIDIDNEQFIKEEKGTKKLDIVVLRNKLTEMDARWGEYFEDYIVQLADQYIGNISNAMSLVTSGTTSIADTEKFIQSYQDLGFTGDTTNLFNYNKVLQAWTLDGSVLQDYIQRQAEQLELLGYDTTEWYEDQIQSIAKNVDISSYITAEDRSNTGDAYKELTNAMYQYYKVQGYNDALITSIINQEIENLNAGGSAMIATAKRWVERQGKTLTSTEIDSMLSDSVSRITDKYTGIIEELVNFTTHDNLSQVAKEAEAELSNANGAVIISAENALDAAEAFLATLAEQIGQPGYTLKDYNATAKSILDKTLFNKGGNAKALVDFASGDIGTDALENLANTFGIQLNKLVDVTTGEVLGYMRNSLKYNAASGNYEIQGTFDGFISALQTQFGITIDKTSQQYVDALKKFNDAKIEKEHEIDKAITEELKAIATAKDGDQINLAQTYTLLWESLDTLGQLRLQGQLKVLGAEFTDGILTIENGANISQVIQKIVSEVSKAAQLIPEEIAELNDALADALRTIAGLISNGINGKLSYTDKNTLESWAEDNGIKQLYFQQTADGFKLITSSVEELYEALRKTNPALTQSLLSDIQNEMPQYKDFVSTLQSLNSNVSQKQAALMTQINNASIRGTVATAYEARPQVLDEAGNIQTYYSVSASNEKGATVLVTPILPDGTMMTTGWAEDYAEKFANEEITLDTRLVGEDGKDLEYTLKDIFMGLYDTQEAADAAANAYHEYHDAVIEAKKGTDDLTDSVSESSAMMQDLIRTMMTDPNNFKFMDRALPDEIQSVVNTYESASQAMKTLDQAGKDGYIGVQDFYNIVETASALMEAAGQEFSVKGQTAAELMQSAANNLVVVDGKLKIDLSGAGMNIVDGIDEMKGNLADGIHELAQAQIDMIDAEIKVLEIFAAMEELGDVDVNGNGISFEVDDIFDDSTESGWTEEFDAYLQGLQDLAEKSPEIDDAFNSVKLFGKKFSELLDMTANEWLELGLTKDQVSQAMQFIQQHDWAADGAEVQKVLSDYLSTLGIPIDVDLDHAIYKFGIKGKSFEINWEDEDVASAVTDYINTHGGSEKDVQEKINHAINDLGQGKGIGNEVDMLTTLRVLKKVKLNDSGEPTEVVIGGKSYELDGNNNEAYLTAAAADELGLNIPDDIVANYDSDAGTLTTTAKVGSKGKTVNVEVDKDGKTTFKYGGESADTLDGLMDKLWEKEWESLSASEKAGKTKDQARSEWEYLNWDIKQPVKTSVTLDNEEIDIKNNKEARDAIRAKIEKLPEDLKLGKDGNLDIDLGNDMHVKLDGDLVVDSKGNLDRDKVVAQLKELLGVDTALEETITAGITKAFAAIPEALNGIEAGPLEAVANALKSLSASAVALMFFLPVIKEQLANLKVDINLDEFSGETIGATIVQSIQDYLNTHKLKLNFDPENQKPGNGGNGGTNGGSGNGIDTNISKNAGNLFDSILAGAGQAFTAIGNIIQNISVQPIENINTAIQDTDATPIENASKAITETKDDKVFAATDAMSQAEPKNLKDASQATQDAVADNFESAEEAINGVTDSAVDLIKSAIESINSIDASMVDSLHETIGLMSTARETLELVRTAIDGVDETHVVTATEALNNLDPGAALTVAQTLASLPKPDVAGNLAISYSISGGASAAGNVTNRALAGGAANTLMGELGPELVVSNGRYFLVGQNGAEFVNLAKDAIVFNHLQTQRLMEKGAINGHGQPFTNEKNAVSYAKGTTGPALVDPAKKRQLTDTKTGVNKADLQTAWSILGIPMPEITNVSASLSPTSWPIFGAAARGNVRGGFAMAGARAAIAQLRKLRSMWESLAGSSVKDLAGLGGSGGGGGGGGGASAADPAAFAAFVREVERWYDYLQEIATLEEKINREEAKREKYQSSFLRAGKEYAKSNLETLKYLREEAVTHQALADAQQEYFDKRREELNTQGAFKDLYTFDENGQLKYNPDLDKNGQKGGLAFLADLLKRDDKGKSKYSVEQQYNILSKYWGDQMKYDSSGNEIVLKADATEDERNTFYANSVQALFDLIDSQQAEMQSLHDSINEHELAVIENQTAANEIMQEIEDNQISVEDKVLDAVISQREQEIDDAQKTRDAIEEASNHLIDGLNTQLDKEREMYDTQNGQQELSRLQSQLAILRSSGGSGSEIANLQKEIASRQKDMYFEAQEQQIAALQEASQNELDRLDAQIDLMNETLEYEKENGLLWNYVYQVMAGTSEEITNFILTYDKQYWGQSPTRDTQTYRQTLFEVDQMIGYKEGMSNGFDEVVQGFSDYAIKKDAEIKNGDKNAEKNATSKAEDYHNTHLPAAPDTSGGGGGNNGSGGNSPGGGGGGKTIVDYFYIDASESIHKKHAKYSDGTTGFISNESHSFSGGVCTKCGRRATSKATNGGRTPSLMKYAKGGLVRHTGPAWLDGTKSKPEMVLNPDQTETLREAIYSEKINSFFNLLQLQGLKDSWYDTNTSSLTGESIIIEQATVEMNVAQISNDYDAQRAGEQALERMVQIARKSQRQNRVGR